jgi:predicted component of type VI protein secretion system
MPDWTRVGESGYRKALGMPKLVFIDRNFAGKVYALTIEKTTIGRGDDNVLVIRDSSLSARHCEILVNGAEVIVRDIGSRNGTMVGGRLLRNQQTAVKNGQIVRFGLVDARVEIENMDWSDDTSPESAVFDHRRVMRDQRRAQNKPAPADPSAKLDPAPSAADDGADPKTFLVPGPAPVASPMPSNQAAEGAMKDEPQKRSTMLVWLAVAAVGGLLLAAWLIWGRK